MMPAGQPASATVVHRDGPSQANSLDGEKKGHYPHRQCIIADIVFHCFYIVDYIV
jgi:hypothetical protein